MVFTNINFAKNTYLDPHESTTWVLHNAEPIIGFCKHFMSESLGERYGLGGREAVFPVVAWLLSQAGRTLSMLAAGPRQSSDIFEASSFKLHPADAGITTSPNWTGLTPTGSTWSPSSPRTSGADESIKVSLAEISFAGNWPICLIPFKSSARERWRRMQWCEG